MSGFMKTVSNLRQNFRACLLAMEAFAALEKPGGVWGGGGGVPSRGLGRTAQVPGYHAADTKRAPRLYLLGGGEGHRGRLFGH